MPETLSQRAVKHLKALLRIDTTNPPGNEEEAAAYVASVLRECGIEPFIAVSAPGRANCIARLSGSGEKGALLFNAHLDVVPAGNEASWRHPPFGAVEDDGFLWGRGAVDMKHMAAMMLAAAEEVAGSRDKLRGDLVFTWTADEERGGRFGAQHIVENHAELLDAEFGVGEVGGFPARLGSETFTLVQTAEKGVVWFKIKAKGPSGHGSMPDPESSVVKLAKAVARLGTTRLPVHVTKTTDLFIRKVLAAMIPGPYADAGAIVLSPKIISRLLRYVPPSPMMKGLWPMLANTVSPTGLQAGESPNVIPEEATAILDGRTIPGQTTQSFLSEVRDVIGDEFEIEVMNEAGTLEFGSDTAFFRHIEATMKNHEPDAKVIPFLNPGFTDGKWFARLGLTWYGFTPLIIRERAFNVMELVHAPNERVSIEAVEGGSEVLYDLISTWSM